MIKKFSEVQIAWFPLIRHGPRRKRRQHQFFVAPGTSLSSCYLATVRVYTDTRSTIISVVAFNRCHGNVFTKPLRGWERGFELHVYATRADSSRSRGCRTYWHEGVNFIMSLGVPCLPRGNKRKSLYIYTYIYMFILSHI
jgi:hypothetical protein